jgi:hypothetical protein
MQVHAVLQRAGDGRTLMRMKRTQSDEAMAHLAADPFNVVAVIAPTMERARRERRALQARLRIVRLHSEDDSDRLRFADGNILTASARHRKFMPRFEAGYAEAQRLVIRIS